MCTLLPLSVIVCKMSISEFLSPVLYHVDVTDVLMLRTIYMPMYEKGCAVYVNSLLIHE